MTEKEQYIRKLNKKIEKLTKLKNLVQGSNKEIQTGKSISKLLNKSVDNTKSLRETVVNTPLSSAEFRKAMYEGTRALDIVEDEYYRHSGIEGQEISGSGTSESIIENTICIALPQDTDLPLGADLWSNNSKLSYLLNGDEVTYKTPSLYKFQRPDKLNKEHDVTYLIEILNEETADHIKNSLINIIIRNVEKDSASIKISDLFCELKGKMYGNKKDLYNYVINEKVNEFIENIKNKKDETIN